MEKFGLNKIWQGKKGPGLVRLQGHVGECGLPLVISSEPLEVPELTSVHSPWYAAALVFELQGPEPPSLSHVI
jgi:hypothetical protein